MAGVSESPSVNDKMSVGTSFTFGNLKGKKTEEAINDQPIEPPKNSNSNDTDPMSQICPKLFVHKHLGSINDNYRMGKTLGEGAFGKVCLVTHKPSEMVRAMKILRKKDLFKDEEKELCDEIELLRNLDHPNILKLFEFFEDDVNYFIITEYCTGGELFDKIISMQSFNEKLAAQYMKQIISAVSYLHTKNIVHRYFLPIL